MIASAFHLFLGYLCTVLFLQCLLRANSDILHRWAWQNPHITLHIPPESRIQQATAKKRSGQPKRPRHSVSSLISNLHLLLRVDSFSRWPLELQFYSEDVYKAWLRWTKTAAEPIRGSINIIQGFPPAGIVASDRETGSPGRKRRKTSHHGISALDIDYTNQKAHVEKGKSIMDFEREGACTICQQDLEHDAGIYAVCPNPGCESVTHLACLSKHSLQHEDEGTLIPIKGGCPTCKAEFKWVDVVKELSLRMRGQKEVEKLLKKKRVRKGKAVSTSQAATDSSEDEGAHDDDAENDFDEVEKLKEFNLGNQGLHGDDWHAIDDTEDSDTGSITSNASQAKKETSYQAKDAGLATVIEDSDWDDSEILD
jgi:structure-specific endonuclease subunit SLX1